MGWEMLADGDDVCRGDVEAVARGRAGAVTKELGVVLVEDLRDVFVCVLVPTPQMAAPRQPLFKKRTKGRWRRGMEMGEKASL